MKKASGRSSLWGFCFEKMERKSDIWVDLWIWKGELLTMIMLYAKIYV